MNDTFEISFLDHSVPVIQEKKGKESKQKEKINILWTGGFDSTFRMIQLSKEDVDIQPYYLCDKRRSEEHELNAIAAITQDIKNHPETRCTILPLTIINVNDIEPDATLTEAYKRLNASTLLGSQYDWLGRFAKSVPGLELSLEKSNTSKAYNCILKHGKLLKVKSKETSYYTIDTNNSTADLIKVFGNYRLPFHLFNLTKLKMTEMYKELGFQHTLGKTWFCHCPFKNEPCGICNPCKSVIEEGLTFRMTTNGMKRYKLYLKYGQSRWFNLSFKMLRLIANSR